ncbi:MAG: type II secretion system protein GspC [Desulfosalsimonadaceae bacterium]
MGKRIFFLVNLALLTLGVYFAVGLFYQVLLSEVMPRSVLIAQNAAHDAAGAENSAAPGYAGSGADFSDYQAIIDRNLFSIEESSEKAEKQSSGRQGIALDNLEQTKLNLKLWGTVTGSTEEAYAVIEDKKKGEQGLYHQGDTIEGARIKMILRKKVVLRVDGKDEILSLEEKEGAAGSPDSRISRGSGSAGTEHVSLEKNKIDSALNNVNELMQQARVRPYFKDGKPSGLLLSHIRENSFFTRLGLKSGDIIKGVNGERIQTVEDALSFYNNLKSESSVRLHVERGDREKTIAYQIQ